jgi:hypothetical protein
MPGYPKQQMHRIRYTRLAPAIETLRLELV